MNGNPTALRIIPWIIAVSLFMEALDMTILATAIPKMAESLHIPPLDLKFALTSYLLSLALFIPISGWVADKWGTRNVFFGALLLFTLSSVGCGCATSLSELVILRTFPKEELVRTMSFIIMPAAIGPMIGPTAGGFITTYLSWPWIFFINIPFGCVGALLARRYIPNDRNATIRPFDTLGFCLFGGSLVGLTFSLETLHSSIVPSMLRSLLFASALLTAVLFWWHYRKTPYPVLNASLFRFPTFRIASLGNLVARLGMSIPALLLPLFLQIGIGLSPLDAGLLLAAGPLGFIGTKTFIPRLLKAIGYRTLLSCTSILSGLAIASFSFIHAIHPLFIALLIGINGFISAAQYSAMSALYYLEVPDREMGDATSIASTLQQLSLGLGIAASALILQFFSGWRATPVSLDVPPFSHAFLAMGLFTFLSSGIFLQLHKRRA
jgi:MFS family permease